MPCAHRVTTTESGACPSRCHGWTRGQRKDAALRTLFNIVWFILAGWWLALGHLTTAIAQAITIIGIPLAIANLKMLPVSLVPFGKEIVPSDSLPAGQRPLHAL